jgi:DNA-binding IclR family transcriptional regulator
MRKNDPGAPATPTIQVIERMFSLIDVLASREESVSLKEISEKTGLHPSTTHRILNDLATGRFVDRPEAGSYRLGMRLLELGNLVKGRLNVRDAALTPVRELHKLIQQPVNLSMRQGDEIVYIERAYSERSGMQVVRAIGGRAPLHLTSVGKLFLAADDPQRVRAYATRTGLAGHTKNSITQLTILERELAKARQYGIAVHLVVVTLFHHGVNRLKDTKLGRRKRRVTSLLFVVVTVRKSKVEIWHVRFGKVRLLKPVF